MRQSSICRKLGETLGRELKKISQKLFELSFGDESCPNLFTAGLSTQMMDLRVIRNLCRHFNSKEVLEIGVRYGHTAKFILDQCPGIKSYIGIDVPIGFRTENPEQQREVPLQTGIIASGDERFNPITLKNGTSDIENGTFKLTSFFDLIFIDADHSFSGIQRDTKISEKLIKEGGVIIWHDYGNEKGVTDFLNSWGKNDDELIFVEETICCFKRFHGK